MSKLADYLPPQIKSTYPGKKSGKKIKGFFVILIHALLPHEIPAQPNKKIISDHITEENADIQYDLSLEFFKESNETIDSLEEKGFKLLTYITAIAAVPIYLLTTASQDELRLFIYISLITNGIALLISMRCIGVKIRRGIHLTTLFKFDDLPGTAPVDYDKKRITANLINMSVHNYNVATNTADVYNATRKMLLICMFFTLVACCVHFLPTSSKHKEEPVRNIVSFSDSTFLKELSKKQNTLDSLIILNRSLQNEKRLDSAFGARLRNKTK
jgi:hypothetical protein